MSNAGEVVIGLDLGTQGVRAIAVTPEGKVVATASEKLVVHMAELPPGWHEQDAHSWWAATSVCLRHLSSLIPSDIHAAGIAIDSTSGTVLSVDALGNPLYMGIMYNDSRSAPYEAEVRSAGQELEQSLGYAFSSSFALNKMVWLRHERPEVFKAAAHLIAPTDFIVGSLTGNYSVSDYSNVLKTGYDLINFRWPQFIENVLGIPLRLLPEVKAPGELVGILSAKGASESGLPSGLPVYAGVTDGTAAQIASGAVEPGAWNSTLGTTLVLKGISRQLLLDPLRRIYCHRHPEGWWMPGGASNTGAEWIEKEHPGADLAALDRQAWNLLPTRLLRYPLARKGERFPFVCPQAESFLVGDLSDPMEAYAAGLEGVAFVERMEFDLVDGIGAEVNPEISATGGGSRSEIWLKVRASVLGRTILRPAVSEASMGAALLAAAGVWYGSLTKAAQAMVKPSLRVEPDLALQRIYTGRYEQFLSELRSRGYWQEKNESKLDG